MGWLSGLSGVDRTSMLIGERARRVTCPYQNKLRGQGTWPQATRGHVGKWARWQGVVLGRDAVAPLLLEIKDTRTARSAAPTQYQRHKDATQSRPYPRQRYPGTWGYLQERVAVGKNRDT